MTYARFIVAAIMLTTSVAQAEITYRKRIDVEVTMTIDGDQAMADIYKFNGYNCELALNNGITLTIVTAMCIDVRGSITTTFVACEDGDDREAEMVYGTHTFKVGCARIVR